MSYSPEGKFIVTDELSETLADLDKVLDKAASEDGKLWYPPKRTSGPIAGNANLAEAAKVGSGKAIFCPTRSGTRDY